MFFVFLYNLSGIKSVFVSKENKKTKMKYPFVYTVSMLMLFHAASGLWCYECVSTQPGCSTPFNWLWHWTKICPEDNDVCVKLLEKKDTDVLITRACLSTLRGYRTDIPADHYEGCRPAALDVKLGNYVNNSVKELDVHRDYYQSTTYCFCFLDHRCNSSNFVTPSYILSCLSFLYILLYIL